MLKKVDRMLNREIKRGKSTELSLFEKVMLKNTGRNDALHGLPEKADGETWISPFIHKEMNACNESHYKVYGRLQVFLEDSYRKAGELAEKIAYLETYIEDLRSAMPQSPNAGSADLRKGGEERLTDSQVLRRRQREYDVETREAFLKIDKIREEMDAAYRSLIEINNLLVQKNTEADIACSKIRSHTQQRVDYYWSAAFHASYEKEKEMPVIFGDIVLPDVVHEYRRMCKRGQEKIEAIISRCSRVKEENEYEHA